MCDAVRVAKENVIALSRRVAAPAAQVWAMVSDVTRMGEWSPETVECTWLKGATGPAVGARFRGVNRLGTHRWATTCTVTAATPGEVFAFTARGGGGLVRIADWVYSFEPDGDDACVVTETWINHTPELALKLGPLISGVSDRRSHNRQGMATTLENLARVAEEERARGDGPG